MTTANLKASPTPPFKRIDEIGISDWPWKCDEQYVDSAKDEPVATIGVWDKCEQNGAMIKETPNLYDCLYDACIQTCLSCKYHRCSDEGIDENLRHCIVKDKWIKTLKRASGEKHDNPFL